MASDKPLVTERVLFIGGPLHLQARIIPAGLMHAEVPVETAPIIPCNDWKPAGVPRRYHRMDVRKDVNTFVLGISPRDCGKILAEWYKKHGNDWRENKYPVSADTVNEIVWGEINALQQGYGALFE